MRVVLIDDEQPNLELLKLMMEKRNDIEVTAAYTNSVEAWAAIAQDPPDIVFSDIEMPQMNGIELAQKVKMLPQEVSVVFVTAYVEYAVDAFNIGAIHYLLKPVTDEGIDNCIQRVLRGRPELRKKDNRWHVRCFGQLEVYGEHAGEAVRWPTTKAAELFAILVLNEGRSMDKWDLCEKVWPNLNSKRMEHNLYSTVNRIRQALREVGADNVILRDSQGYRVELSQFTCDYLEFKSLLPQYFGAEGLDAAKRIANLHREPLFGSADYPWVDAERAQIQALVVDCLRTLTKQAQSISSTQALPFLNRLLEVDPCDEKVVSDIMRIYAKRKNRAALVQTYDNLNKRLKEELNLKPGYATQHLYSELLANI